MCTGPGDTDHDHGGNWKCHKAWFSCKRGRGTGASGKKITFDKTGTLTYGTPKVIAVRSILPEWKEEDIYGYCAAAEQLSEHPLGKAVVNCYRQEMKRELLSTGQFEMIPGRGVSCEVDTHTILAGNVDMLHENRINFPADVEKKAEEFLNEGCTMIY